MRFHELDALRPDQLDFVPRERRSQITKVMLAFSMAVLLVLVAAYTPLSGTVAPYIPILAILLIALLGVFVTFHNQIILDLLMSNEYQNMLLAQGFGVGPGFGLIVRRDARIVHASEGIDAIFPQFDYSQSQALDSIFEQGLVRKADRERIIGAIHNCTGERIVFPIIAPYEAPKEYILTVQPMARPSGFSVIRCREFLGKRTGLQMLPDGLSLTSVDKIEHLLTTTSIPHFTTDAFGRIEYANPAFDRALGYEAGEIVESKLSLHHLIFLMGQTLITEEYTLSEHVGAVELIHKNGKRINGTLQQTILRDANGKAMGATGTLAVHSS